MFQNESLKDYLNTSASISSQSFISAEWNLNLANNILQVGNYRYRPLDNVGTRYKTPNPSFDPSDAGYFYTDATNSDVFIDGGFIDPETPDYFITSKKKEEILFSLEDCLKRFRPRSGINKARYFGDNFIHHTNSSLATRPRYYMPDKNDEFKYWSSYRTSIVYEYEYADGTFQYGDNPEFSENGIVYTGTPYQTVDRGIANRQIFSAYFIDDASPFVVYKNAVPSNRIVVKMQTHVGTTDLGPFSSSAGTFSDPLFGDANKVTPVDWTIQILKNNVWVDAVTFNANSLREDGTAIVKEDGYVEIYYSNGSWSLFEEDIASENGFVTDLVNPAYTINPTTGQQVYDQIDYISGIRVAVKSMSKLNSTFDLIELSPRLVADITEMTVDYNITKAASDLGISGLPVGQLLASTGSITIFDPELAFFSLNDNSIISNFYNQNLQVKFYEKILNSDETFYVPIKTMYTEEFPETSVSDRTTSVSLRDQFFYFESLNAPELLIEQASLSYAVSSILDYIGFSNYTFKRIDGESDPIIPFFFVSPDKTVAEILQDLAISTQTAMFFDEYNNFVCMSKKYIMPEDDERATDIVLYGTKDQARNGIVANDSNALVLPSIIDVASKENSVFNDGKILYSTKYIQRSYGSLRQANLIDREKTWSYKPVLLWEVSPSESTKSINDELANQSKYVLGAMPLNSDLSDALPTVVQGEVIDNVIDFGEAVYWITRYNGYFYANGEIIKYDAVEYTIPGFQNDDSGSTFWISSVRDYQKYFSQIPFNGKMFPTGRVRIYSEPNYETINGVTRLASGAVAKHGRGQFGTEIVEHFAGLNPYWVDNENVAGCLMRSEFLFRPNSVSLDQISQSTTIAAGKGSNRSNDIVASRTPRNGIIRNFLSSSYYSENEIARKYSTETGTLQSSALIMTGQSIGAYSPIDFLTYVHKPLNNRFTHFGTRMRIVGRVRQDATGSLQSPSGSVTYYTTSGSSPDKNISIGAASGGLAVLVNPETNVGYYFEMAALTDSNVDQYVSAENVHNLYFYKIVADSSTGEAIPVKLWGGIANVIVDSGDFAGQYRLAGEENPTVYDLSVEYQDIGNIRRFFLYLNNKQVATVDDVSPIQNIQYNMALFTRGSSKCMFENIYALTNNYAVNMQSIDGAPVKDAFKIGEVNQNEAYRKYSLSGALDQTYLSTLSPQDPPAHSIYYDEFGTIMREAAYFNIRYDKAYPALYAEVSPTFNKLRGYSVSGFRAGAYGAEFLIFNTSDTAINLDETSGNYLRIQGVTFTQNSSNELSVDDFYNKYGDLSQASFVSDSVIRSSNIIKKEFEDIRISRLTYGKKEFSIDAPYIQSHDEAVELMAWLMPKISKPRLAVGLSVFANPTIQLGDIVSIDYEDSSGVTQISSTDKRFVVYNIEYSRAAEGPTMVLYLSEVV